MIWKCFVILILLVSTMLLGVVGCGSDTEEPEVFIEEKPEEPVIEPAVPLSSKADLFGSWEVVSIFGKTPKEYLESFTVGGEAEINVKHLNYVFAADDSWTCDFKEKTVIDFPDIPPGEIEAIGTWSGTYAFDGLTLSIFTKESEVHIAPEPKDFFQVALDMALAEAEQDYDEGVRSDIIKPFARSTCTKQGDTLVLITATGEEMVLEKQ